MEYKYKTRPLRERVGLRVWPIDPATIVPVDPATTFTIIREVEDAGVPHIWLPSGAPWSPDLFIVLAAAATRTTRVTRNVHYSHLYTPSRPSGRAGIELQWLSSIEAAVGDRNWNTGVSNACLRGRDEFAAGLFARVSAGPAAVAPARGGFLP